MQRLQHMLYPYVLREDLAAQGLECAEAHAQQYIMLSATCTSACLLAAAVETAFKPLQGTLVGHDSPRRGESHVRLVPQVNEVSGEAMEERAEAELLRLQR